MKKSIIQQAIEYAVISSFAFSMATHAAFAKNSENQTAYAAQQAPKSQGYTLLSDNIHKSPNDKAQYQGITLANGMTVLLISDPKANKSLMSLALPIGSMEDPIKQQGLAHYLEHMILMGSKNYPETNSLNIFLTQNGGLDNASTTSDRTAYYLEVNNDAFDEAVARLADAFAAPLLAESNAKKEVNAVNAEMIRAKSSDGHLLHSVDLATANPQHPVTKFTVGNHQTLSDKADSQLQTELEQFYQRYYSANLVKAVLYSNQSIQQMAALAEKTLGQMQNKHIKAPQVDMPLYREQDKGVLITYKPIQPTKMLAITFDMPNDEAQFAQKTGEYLAYVLNNNTENTLSDYLIKQGLSDSGISADVSPNVSRNRGAFTIYVALTDKGLAQKDQVISLIFQQIENIKQAGIQESYFQEVKESLKQDFAHLQVVKTGTYVESLAIQMLNYPLAHILDANYIATEMDTAAIKAKLSLMNLDNARILLVDDKAQTDKKTPYFEAGYSISKFSPAQRQQWLDFSKNPTLSLPARNPYFATDFSLITQEKREKPKLIAQSTGSEIFNMQSQFFAEDPKARLSLSFSISPKNDELKNSLTATLLSYMAALASNKLEFQSSVAGMESNLSALANGVTLTAEGYTQHLAQLLQNRLTLFKTFELTESELTQAKQRANEALDRRHKENSLNQANEIIANFAHYPYFDEPSQRQAIDAIQLSDIEKMRERLLTQATGLNLLSVGNLTDTQVTELVNALKSTIKNQDNQLNQWRYLDVSQHQRKLNFVTQVQNEDNALSVIYLPKGYDELAGNASSSLLRDIISRWYFDDLRTNKQLGYVVNANNYKIGITSGLRFMVQSPNTSPAGIMQHNQRFFAETLQKLTNLTPQEFEQFKKSLLDKLQRKPESLGQEFSRFVTDLNRHNHQFNQLEQTIHAVQALTKQDIIDFYRQAVIEQTGLVFMSQALGTQATIKDAVVLEGFENINSIEQLQHEFPIKTFASPSQAKSE